MKKAVGIASLAAVFAVLGTLDCEANSSNSEGFTYKGAPIRPECLDAFEGEQNKVVDLSTNPCQKKDHPFDQKALKNGLIGYDSFYPDEQSSYFYYDYLGVLKLPELNSKPYDIVYVEYNSGGTGQFTDMMVLDREGDKLRYVISLNGGDRCVGGLSEASLKNGVLKYKQAVTPDQFYTQATGADSSPFTSCSICCVGTFSYEGTNVTGFTFSQGNYNFETNEEDPQSCFDKLLKETFTGGKVSLTAPEIKAFGEKLKANCVKAPVEKK